MVGDDVDDDAQPGVMGFGTQPTKILFATALLLDLGVVYDVIAVSRSRRGLQNRGAEHMTHAKSSEVVELSGGVGEGEVLVELQTVR